MCDLGLNILTIIINSKSFKDILIFNKTGSLNNLYIEYFDNTWIIVKNSYLERLNSKNISNFFFNFIRNNKWHSSE